MKRMSQNPVVRQILGIAAATKPAVKPEPHVLIRGVPFYFRDTAKTWPEFMATWTKKEDRDPDTGEIRSLIWSPGEPCEETTRFPWTDEYARARPMKMEEQCEGRR